MCLPSNPVSLDSAWLQPPQRNSEADWFAGHGPYRLVVFYSCPIFSHKFQLKGPEVEGEFMTESGKYGLGVISLRFKLTPSLSAPLLPACPLLRRSFGLISSHHCGAITVFLLGGGAPWGRAAVWRRATAGGDGSVGKGQREGQGVVRWCGQGIPIPFWWAQGSRRWKRERQRESSHVEEPANTPCHLSRREEHI